MADEKQDDQKKLPTRPASVLEDPGTQAVAQVYAEAFVGAARETGAGPEDALEEFESFLQDVLEGNPEFASILTSTIVGRDDKLRMIDRVVAPHGTQLFANFLRVLAKNDRLDLLPAILEQSRQTYEKQTGRRRVEVTSATPLSKERQEEIKRRLAERLPFEPILQSRVDPSLLGGVVIRVGDTVYDGSVRARLKQLRGRLHERSIHEIQSGRDRFSHPEGD